MMKTRDRLEEVSNNILKNKGSFQNDGKELLNDYISMKNCGLVQLVMLV